MEMDWGLVSRFALSIFALFVGGIINHYLERRPKLISYLGGHASAVPIQPPQGQSFDVNTHSIVVRNAGSRAATNVRLGHHILPNSFNVFPSVQYRVEKLPGGGSEIVFPILVPGEQVTISYLYYPLVYWNNVNSYTKSDEGFAKIIRVLPTPEIARWLRISIIALMFLGVATVLAGLVQLIAFFWRLAVG